MKIREVLDFLNSIAPYDTQCSWDNSGLMTGSPEKETDKIMLCLDCTNDVLEQAKANGCGLIICHHPLIFSPLKSVCDNTTVYNAIKNDITVISAHTNLDMAQGGVNDVLCEKLGLKNTETVQTQDGPLLRMGDTSFETVTEFASLVAKTLGEPVQCLDAGRKVSNVAVCGGAGGDFVADAFSAGCDTFVTGEAKHHQFLEAKELGINLIVAGHFSTEKPVVENLCDKLLSAFPGHSVYVAFEECPYFTVV